MEAKGSGKDLERVGGKQRNSRLLFEIRLLVLWVWEEIGEHGRESIVLNEVMPWECLKNLRRSTSLKLEALVAMSEVEE